MPLNIDASYIDKLGISLLGTKTKYKIDKPIKHSNRNRKNIKDMLFEWIDIVKSFPGIIFNIAISKDMDNLPFLDKKQNDITYQNVYDKKPAYLLFMLQSLYYLIPLSKILRKNHKVILYSDNDPIFDKKEYIEYFLDSGSHLLKKRNCEAKFEFCTPKILEENSKKENSENDKINKHFVKPHFEEILSIPDLNAGWISASLSKTYDKESAKIGFDFQKICCDISEKNLSNRPIFALFCYDCNVGTKKIKLLGKKPCFRVENSYNSKKNS